MALGGCLDGSAPAPDSSTPLTRALEDAALVANSSAPRKADLPHVHDYWEGAFHATLLDEKVPLLVAHNHEFDEPPRDQHTHGCDERLDSTSQGGSRKFSLPTGQIVLPGTASLDFTFAWETPTITGVWFKFRSADSHEFVDAGPMRNGATFTLPVSIEMADAGHTTQTKWGFFLCATSNVASVALAEGDVATKIVAHRAPKLPVEPAHADLWLGKTTLTLSHVQWSGTAISLLNKGQDSWRQMVLHPGATVPPYTSRLTATVHYNTTSPEALLDPGAIMFYYRDSTVPEWVYKTANSTRSVPGMIVYDIPVTHDMVDGVYAKVSNWDFWTRVVSNTHATTPGGTGTHGAPHVFQGDIHASLEAIRGPGGDYQ